MTTEKELREKIFHILRYVSKPARYVGGELNVVKKDPQAQSVRVCLAFPDVYEIGQSYMGFHILYHILNNRPGTLCERTFAPWPDMENIMHKENIPLWSLESFLPVASFDVVGFTLQYELHYTTVLNMLDLAGIPVRADKRDEHHPLILGGGTCCVNPEPMTDFFDAFLIGDGEEAFPEMLTVIEEGKKKSLSRKALLKNLTRVEGVYVPSLYRPVHNDDGVFTGMEPVGDDVPFPVRARFVEELKPEYYPDKPLVPLCEIVHDRLSIEIMRGCSRGCRFCNGGMLYRPKRVRPAGEVVDQIVRGLRATGWDEVSLVSLSTTDYPEIKGVITRLGTSLSGKLVSVSLSSLRADNFSLSIAETVAGGRKTGLTFAVEAGTQRLRDVINKNLTEDQLIQTVEHALGNGWKGIKLYFMIGLPTETRDDVIAIADLLNRLGAILHKHHGRRINVTVSPFSPKPLTPFQWETQDSVAVLREKVALIKNHVTSRGVVIKDFQPFLSMLECRLARGGRVYGNIIYDAWKQGSRLDGWSEHFHEDIWRSVLESAGVNVGESMAGIDPGAILPWGHLRYGVDEEYLLRERERASKGETTDDCARKCHRCGPYETFCSAQRKKELDESVQKSAEPEAGFGRKKKALEGKVKLPVISGTNFRIRYGKKDEARFIGHLDVVRMFDRTLRRADIPVAYSQGYHPHQKLSFGPPLPLGMRSIAEYIDITLSSPFPHIEEALQRELPRGIDLLGVRGIPERTESLTKCISQAEYFIRCEVSDSIADMITSILRNDTLSVVRESKHGVKTVPVRGGIISITTEANSSGIMMLLSLDQMNAVKPLEVMNLIFGDNTPDDITRMEQYGIINGKRVTPFELM